jgi:hypothetical protein
MAALNKKSPKTISIKNKMAKCPDIYQDVQYYRDKYMKKNFKASLNNPRKPAEIMRQPSKVFSKEFK